MKAIPAEERESAPLCRVGCGRAAARALRVRYLRRLFVSGLSALALSLGCASPTLAASCRVFASGLAFGIYNPFALTALDSTTRVLVSCSVAPNEFVAFQMSASTGASLNYGARLLRGPYEDNLYYNLYTDPARSIVWGDGSGSSVVINDALPFPLAGGIGRFVDVYGRIPARQNVRPQSYGDTILITVNF